MLELKRRRSVALTVAVIAALVLLVVVVVVLWNIGSRDPQHRSPASCDRVTAICTP